MSEYQRYEFVALDRPLSARDMGELRAISTRAEQLVALEPRQEAEWAELDALVGAPKVKPSVYEDVVHRLTALRELAVMRGTEDAFHARLGVLLDRHGSKTAFRRRVQEAALARADERG